MRIRRFALATTLVAALGVLAAPAALADAPTATYEITITNLTDGQWMTPPAAATHNRSFDIYDVRRPASEAVQQLAENGNLAPLTSAFDASSAVSDWTVAIADPDLPPLAPGGSVTFTLEGDRGARHLSFASMLICTNDGFTGIDGLKLPRNMGNTLTGYTRAYDAGTEINTEAWADLVPPCAQLTGFGDQGGTGASNPDLAEDGVIKRHRGIGGIADLVPGIHGWHGAVAKIEVTRVG